MLNRHCKAPTNISGVNALGLRQSGVTLLEALISLALSTLVIIGMVVLMGNSMGTTNRITQMAQLNDQLRNVMSMLTRDVRRANYSAASILCYGNPYCGQQPLTRQEGGDTPLGNHMIIEAGCLIYQVDRIGNYDGDATNDSKGGFRLVDDDGVGVVQMWVNAAATVPACDDDVGADGWIAVTDPNIVDIVDFTIDDSLSIEKSIFQDDGETEFTQRQRYLQLGIEGELVLERRMGWVAGSDEQMIRRRVQDEITVRNDYLWPPEAVAP
jgi:prepilin peptidase dependent protein B